MIEHSDKLRNVALQSVREAKEHGETGEHDAPLDIADERHV